MPASPAAFRTPVTVTQYFVICVYIIKIVYIVKAVDLSLWNISSSSIEERFFQRNLPINEPFPGSCRGGGRSRGFFHGPVSDLWLLPRACPVSGMGIEYIFCKCSNGGVHDEVMR